MPKVEKPCIFNGNMECEPRMSAKSVPLKKDWDLTDLAKNVCPICPTRIEMLPYENVE